MKKPKTYTEVLMGGFCQYITGDPKKSPVYCCEKAVEKMAFNRNHFKSRHDALSRAKARHVCLDCRHWQAQIYKLCPQCGSKNRQYFMSESEHHRGIGLLTMQSAGVISELEFQPSFPLHVNGIKIGKYIADYAYKEKGMEIKTVEDRKGSAKHIEPLSKWKMLHFRAEYGHAVKITT